MTEHHCGAIPIVRHGKLPGIITDRRADWERW